MPFVNQFVNFIASRPLLMMFVCIIAILIVVALVSFFFASPFSYPYFIRKFDVSNKRRVDIVDYVERFLLDPKNVESLRSHQRKIENWKKESEAYIQNCRLKKWRRRQYLRTLDDSRAYKFIATRKQTRYRQRNYVKYPYEVVVEDSSISVNWHWIENRVKKLISIGYEATQKDYRTKNQRKLMTPALRKEIMERDNYTCQICGKRMPDGVGLHIDHIVPISKGGKTVPSNLQVLCSKCNLSKGAK